MMSDPKELFLQQLSDPAAKTKIAAEFSGYVKDRLREASFTEKVLPPQTVTRADCQISVNHDSLVKIEHLEPRSKAMVVTFRGEPNAKLIRGERVEVPFITIMSEMYQKPEQEFLAYPYPIGKVIEQNSVKDIQEIQDRQFVIHSEASVQALQKEANGGSTTALHQTTIAAGSVVEASVIKGELARVDANNDGRVWPIQRPDLVNLMSLLDGNRLECELLLMTAVDLNNVLQWTVEDNGSKVQSETTVSGWQHNTLLGKKVVRTIKTDILRPGNVYAYTSPEFLGRFYILNNVKFYIDKVINLIKFVAWKDIGMSLVNIASVRKLELYSGDATSLDTDSISASVTPKSEEDLGAVNNRAAEREFFPNVVTF